MEVGRILGVPKQISLEEIINVIFAEIQHLEARVLALEPEVGPQIEVVE